MLPTLIELQRLKRLDRTGWTLRGLANGTESVAAHSFGVCVTAMMLADQVRERGVLIDAEKVLRMALVHDWAETRVGDMPKTATAYFGNDERRRAETSAFADIVEGSSCATLYLTAHEEYEKRESLESRLVKAADIIDLLVQALALERSGARGLSEFWAVLDTDCFQLEGAAQEVVGDLIRALRSERNKIQ